MGHAELQPEDIDENISALRGAIKRTWNDFCDTTSIHGLKFTRDEGTNKYIRLIWIFITIIMLVCAILMVTTFYVDYRSNPTRMHVENDHAPIASTIFPPTTICPEVMYNMQNSYEYLKTLTLPANTTVADIFGILHINNGFVYDNDLFDAKDIELLVDLLAINNIHILEFVKKLRWSCKDLLFRCRFKNVIVPCDELFQVSSTFIGYCCSFNLNHTGLHFKNRKAHAGLRNGLSIILYYNDSMFDLARSYSIGFKIIIQETNAYPSPHSVIKFVPFKEETFITVQPTETFCSQAVEELPFEERQCMMPYEKELQYFRSYHGPNCNLNCRVSMMMKYCKCYTHFFYSNRTQDRICTYKDIPCLMDNFDNIIGRLVKNQCPCYRSCEQMQYDVQLTSGELQLDIPTIDRFYDGIQKHYSVVHIYMNSQVYRRVRHDLLSSMVTLVSNLGSAFSLFVGMSMVSIVEIIYFFTIILRKYYKQECKAREMLIEKKTKIEGNANTEDKSQNEKKNFK